MKKTVATSALILSSLLVPTTASAFTDNEWAFVADMQSRGIVAHHGEIDTMSQWARPVLNLGYNFCNNVRQHGLLNAKRVLMVNSQTRSSMGEVRQLDSEDIEALATSAQLNLCPDTQ